LPKVGIFEWCYNVVYKHQQHFFQTFEEMLP
jgi:hypothetical protein